MRVHAAQEVGASCLAAGLWGGPSSSPVRWTCSSPSRKRAPAVALPVPWSVQPERPLSLGKDRLRQRATAVGRPVSSPFGVPCSRGRCTCSPGAWGAWGCFPTEATSCGRFQRQDLILLSEDSWFSFKALPLDVWKSVWGAAKRPRCRGLAMAGLAAPRKPCLLGLAPLGTPLGLAGGATWVLCPLLLGTRASGGWRRD